MTTRLVAKSPELFYGTSTKLSSRWHEALEARLLQMKEQPISEPYRCRLSSPTCYWKVFHRQQEALEFALEDPSKELKVFAYESDAIGSEGQRLYVAASIEHFYHYYRQPAMAGKRHHYEVIGEGTPCKLYFDLEFPRECNVGLDGGRAVSIFKRYVCKQVQSHLGIVCEDAHIVDLDSSSTVKFSRHLIFITPLLVFSNNIHAGNFVRHICQPFLRRAEAQKVANSTIRSCSDPSEPPASPLTPPADNSTNEPHVPVASARSHSLNEVSAGLPSYCAAAATQSMLEDLLDESEIGLLLPLAADGTPALLCDLGVYTRNRNFRLLMSSKRGKKEVLQLCSDCEAYRLRLPERLPAGYPGTAADCDRQIFLDSLITADLASLPPSLITFDTHDGSSRVGWRQQCTAPTQDGPSLSGARHSPFPELDAFISNYLATGQGCRPGSIRRWKYFSNSETLVYDVANNRWCSRLQREHKSNNTMVVVKLQEGVYYRTCHDPDCRASSYEPIVMRLPEELLPRNYIRDDDDDFDDCDGTAKARPLECSTDQGSMFETLQRCTPFPESFAESMSSDDFIFDEDLNWDPL